MNPRQLLLITLCLCPCFSCAYPTKPSSSLSDRPNPPVFLSIEGKEKGVLFKIAIPSKHENGTICPPLGTLTLFRSEGIFADTQNNLPVETIFSLSSSDPRVAQVFEQGSVTLQDVRVTPDTSYFYQARFDPENSNKESEGIFSAPLMFSWQTPPQPPTLSEFIADGPVIRVFFQESPTSERGIKIFRRDIEGDGKASLVVTCFSTPCVDTEVLPNKIYAFSFRSFLITPEGSIEGPLSREHYLEVPPLPGVWNEF